MMIHNPIIEAPKNEKYILVNRSLEKNMYKMVVHIY
jgi:hypothetical protein